MTRLRCGAKNMPSKDLISNKTSKAGATSLLSGRSRTQLRSGCDTGILGVMRYREVTGREREELLERLKREMLRSLAVQGEAGYGGPSRI